VRACTSDAVSGWEQIDDALFRSVDSRHVKEDCGQQVPRPSLQKGKVKTCTRCSSAGTPKQALRRSEAATGARRTALTAHNLNPLSYAGTDCPGR
jgi:hypothetical protein